MISYFMRTFTLLSVLIFLVWFAAELFITCSFICCQWCTSLTFFTGFPLSTFTCRTCSLSSSVLWHQRKHCWCSCYFRSSIVCLARVLPSCRLIFSSRTREERTSSSWWISSIEKGGYQIIPIWNNKSSIITELELIIIRGLSLDSGLINGGAL